VVSFSRILSTAEHLVPILLSFYLGSWSDIYGRIPFIAINMTGKVEQIPHFIALDITTARYSRTCLYEKIPVMATVSI
jgi:hypothetical protein